MMTLIIGTHANGEGPCISNIEARSRKLTISGCPTSHNFYHLFYHKVLSCILLQIYRCCIIMIGEALVIVDPTRYWTQAMFLQAYRIGLLLLLRRISLKQRKRMRQNTGPRQPAGQEAAFSEGAQVNSVNIIRNFQ
nr:hypothetical protein [Tanacetum cinerariifolium]